MASKHYSVKYGYTVSPNRELVALGMGNLTNSFVLGIPTFGSLTRSAVADNAGTLGRFICACCILCVVLCCAVLHPGLVVVLLRCACAVCRGVPFNH